MRLQDLLKQQRFQHHLTQGQLAAKLLVSKQAISKWERGQTVPTIDNLLALADLYNISLDELVQGSPFFKKPRVIGHHYHRSHVAIFMLSWLIRSLLVSRFDLKTWSTFLVMLLLISSYLLPLMTQDYWVITQTGLAWRHYHAGWQLPQLVAFLSRHQIVVNDDQQIVALLVTGTSLYDHFNAQHVTQ